MASTSRRAAIRGYIAGARDRLGDAAVDPTIRRKRAGVGERDRRDFPGHLRLRPVVVRLRRPDPTRLRQARRVRTRRPDTTERVLHRTGQVHGAEQHQAGREHASRQPSRAKTSRASSPRSARSSLGARLAPTQYYPSEEAYMTAVAEAVREEYKAITDAGLIVQIDEPNFLTAWMFYPD